MLVSLNAIPPAPEEIKNVTHHPLKVKFKLDSHPGDRITRTAPIFPCRAGESSSEKRVYKQNPIAYDALNHEGYP
jgi:hypothetical protein